MSTQIPEGMTKAQYVRTMPNPYVAAVAPFGENKVTFHFADGSTLTFRKEYHLED